MNADRWSPGPGGMTTALMAGVDVPNVRVTPSSRNSVLIRVSFFLSPSTPTESSILVYTL